MESLRFQISEKGNFIQPDHAIQPMHGTGLAEYDFTDIRIFEFDRQKMLIFDSEFFSLNIENLWPKHSTQLPFFAFGLPNQLQNYDYEMENYSTTVAFASAQYAGRTSSPHLFRTRWNFDPSVDPAGMSGGPVFYIGKNLFGYFWGMAGMILRSGKNSSFMHFLWADYLLLAAFERRNPLT